MIEKSDPFGNLPLPRLFAAEAPRNAKAPADNLATAKTALAAAESKPPKPKGKPHAKVPAKKRPAKRGKKAAKRAVADKVDA
jgi:hypothetical protein